MAAVRVPSWDDVKFFLAIHRAGSLSAAARPLGVTQPTCGRRLKELESSLRVVLFDRTPDGLRITVEGRALLEAAEAMEQSVRALELRAAASSGELEGSVRIATNELFATVFLANAVVDVRKSCPDVRIDLVLSTTEADLLRREADLALRFRPKAMRPTPETLVARKLGDEPFRVYGAASYLDRRGPPEPPDALAGHDVVEFVGPHPAGQWCARAFRGANVVLSASSMVVTASAIAAGAGLGVLPERAARLFPTLRPLSPAIAHGTGWLVVHPDVRKVPRVRVVMDLLVDLYRTDRRRTA